MFVFWKFLIDCTYQREALVQELVLSLVVAGRERDALDELELCESVILRYYIHAPILGIQVPSITSLPREPCAAYVRGSSVSATGGLYGHRLKPGRPAGRHVETVVSAIEIDFFTKRNIEQNNTDVKQTLLREARQHLERAQALDSEGVVAQAFIHKVRPSPLSCIVN